MGWGDKLLLKRQILLIFFGPSRCTGFAGLGFTPKAVLSRR